MGGNLFTDTLKTIGQGMKDAAQNGVNNAANQSIDQATHKTTAKLPNATQGTTNGMNNDAKRLVNGVVGKLFNLGNK